MIALAAAATFALAGSMILATLRLRTQTDKRYGRSYVHVTPAFRIYIFLHGFAALLPFPLHLFWSKESSALVTASPWVVMLAAPLFVNKMVRLEGVNLPEATGRLNRFRNDVSTWIHEALVDCDTAAMRDFIAPFAKDMSLEGARILMSLHLPVHFAPKKAAAIRTALAEAKTAERAMELYIRFVGKHSFVNLFEDKLKEKKLASTPLLDDFERRRQAREKSKSASFLTSG
jgi:hypothetical protein